MLSVRGQNYKNFNFTVAYKNYQLVGDNKNIDEYGNMGFGPSSSSSSSTLLSGSSE